MKNTHTWEKFKKIRDKEKRIRAHPLLHLESLQALGFQLRLPPCHLFLGATLEHDPEQCGSLRRRRLSRRLDKLEVLAPLPVSLPKAILALQSQVQRHGTLIG